MTKNPYGPDVSTETDYPPDSGGPVIAAAAPATEPATAADTVTGAPGRVSVPGVTTADFGPLPPEAEDELGTVLKELSETRCYVVRTGTTSDGKPILQTHCETVVTGSRGPSPFLMLWLTEVLLGQSISARWDLTSSSKYEDALDRASRRSDKLRLLADKAVDVLDAASAEPYYAPDMKPVLSNEAKADCKIIADKLRGVLTGQSKPLADLFDSVASGQPAHQNGDDLNRAEKQLFELQEGTRRWLHKKSQDELRAAGNKGDAFFWRTMARGSAPGPRERD